jgi:hypothetical protein
VSCQIFSVWEVPQNPSKSAIFRAKTPQNVLFWWHFVEAKIRQLASVSYISAIFFNLVFGLLELMNFIKTHKTTQDKSKTNIRLCSTSEASLSYRHTKKWRYIWGKHRLYRGSITKTL